MPAEAVTLGTIKFWKLSKVELQSRDDIKKQYCNEDIEVGLVFLTSRSWWWLEKWLAESRCWSPTTNGRGILFAAWKIPVCHHLPITYFSKLKNKMKSISWLILSINFAGRQAFCSKKALSIVSFISTVKSLDSLHGHERISKCFKGSTLCDTKQDGVRLLPDMLALHRIIFSWEVGKGRWQGKPWSYQFLKKSKISAFIINNTHKSRFASVVHECHGTSSHLMSQVDAGIWPNTNS